MAEPTYRTSTEGEETVYHCLVCERQGTEHHTQHEELMTMHQAQRHGGQMIDEAAPQNETAHATAQAQGEHPHGGPPGQTGEHPEHPHGGPPGQTGDHPQGGPPGQEPEPTHPIVEPDDAEKA